MVAGRKFVVNVIILLFQLIRFSESEVFNCLEAIASASQPVTPVLQCRISQALEPQLIGENVRRLSCCDHNSNLQIC